MQDLVAEIEGTKLKQGKQDSWRWKHDSKGVYIVRSVYKAFSLERIPRKNLNFKLIWAKNVPLKISAFAWKALQNRIPTKVNLMKWGLLLDNEDALCVLCGKHEEISDQLLFSSGFLGHSDIWQ